jgi:hypothetical protein
MLYFLLWFACGEPEKERVEGSEPGDCSDNADNDSDGLWDCDDDSCSGALECKESEAPSEDTAISEEILEDTGVYEDTASEEEQSDEIQNDWELFAESDFASGGLYPFATNGCAGIGCPTISNGALYMAGDWNSITVDSSYGDWFASGTSWAVEIDIIDSADAGLIYLRFASSPGHSSGNEQGYYGLIPVNGTPEIAIQSQTTYRIEVDDYNGYIYENGTLLSESNDINAPSDGAQHIGIAFQRAPTNAQPTGTTVSAVRVYSK